ncbi:MAG: YdcF family protein [Hydrogenobaculum sp.]|nr:MAG: YdcF family protein [Hydrogenobaculum sp.]
MIFFTIKKLLTAILIPPGIFIITFFFISFFVKSKKIKVLSFGMTMLFYLLSITPVKDALITPLEHTYNQPKGFLNANAIVVLGGGYYKNGNLSGETVKRLLAGIYLSYKTKIPLILSGVDIKYLPKNTPIVKILDAVDVGNIYEDVKSKDTIQNAAQSYKICTRYINPQCSSIILVTSAYHMPRAKMLFDNFFKNVIPYPVDYKEDLRYNLRSFLPNMSDLENSTKAIREYLGIVYYFILLKVF